MKIEKKIDNLFEDFANKKLKSEARINGKIEDVLGIISKTDLMNFKKEIKKLINGKK